MKNIFKKIACCVVALCIVLGSVVLLTACSETKEEKVMNVDVNPKLEFVLDKEDKVVSVNALNDDGTCILQGNVTFVGLSANEAVNLFLEKSKEYGFVVEADVNALTVSVSGDGADKLLNNVKATAEAKINELELNLTVAKETINREALEQIVAKCYQELTTAQIDELSNTELVDLIKKSREETKDLLTEELKNLYYSDRAEKVISAKIAEIKNQAGLVKQMLVAALETAYTSLETAYNQIQGFYTSAMTSVNEKMEQYIELKKQYIEARKAENTQLANSLKTSVDTLKTSLDTARTAIDNQIATVKTQLDTAKNLVVTKIDELMEGLDESKIQTAVNNAKTEVVNTLKTTYEEINKNLWVEETPAA